MRQCESCTHQPVCKYTDAMKVAQQAAMEIEALTTEDLRSILYPHSIPTIRCKQYEGENLAVVAAQATEEKNNKQEDKKKKGSGRKSTLTDEEYENALILYKKGIGSKEIWRQMGLTCAYTTLYMRLKNEGKKQKEEQGERTIDRGKVMALCNAGWNVRAIAGDMGKKEEEIQAIIDCLRKEEK